jgi:hypothetical protein
LTPDPSVDFAKSFLLSKLEQQAQFDGVPLTDGEKRLFFSTGADETTPLNPDLDGAEFEAKSARLLKHAYAREKRSQASRSAWAGALESLRDEDFYGLVMIDQAGIARPRSRLPVIMRVQMILWLLLYGTIAMAGLAVLYKPAHLPLGAPDWVRIVLWLASIAVILALGGLQRRRNSRQPKGD